MNLLVFLDRYLNDFIWYLAILDFFAILFISLGIRIRFRNLRSELMIPDDGESGTIDVHRLAKISVANEKRQAYSRISAWYNLFAQLISIFPLLGILGTVAGLILNAQAGHDPAGMEEALGLALYSTYYGLIASIVLKLMDTIFSNIFILPIESVFDEYDIDRILDSLKRQEENGRERRDRADDGVKRLSGTADRRSGGE